MCEILEYLTGRKRHPPLMPGGLWLREISTTVDIPNPNAFELLSIYPMPVQQTFQISLPQSVGENVTLTIYNYSGQTVLSHNVSGAEKLNFTVDLPSGFYIATVTAGVQRFAGKMIVVD